MGIVAIRSASEQRRGDVGPLPLDRREAELVAGRHMDVREHAIIEDADGIVAGGKEHVAVA